MSNKPIQNDVDNYTMTSYFLNTYNEVAGTNNYLYNKNAIEKERLEKRFTRLNSLLLKMKQDFMLKQRAIADYNFGINVLQVLVLTISFILILITLTYQGRISVRVVSIIIGFIIVVFIAIVVILVKGNNTRHQDNWNKYYFGPMPTA